MRTAILGAGAVGLTLARQLALAGDEVLLVERAAEPGGLASGFDVGGVLLDKFYHHLFASDTAILDLLKTIGLGDEITWSTPNTSLLINGQPHRLDSLGAALRFAPLPLLDRLRMDAIVGFLRYWPAYRPLQRQRADAWLPRWMGRRAYDTVWKPQLVGKFGDHAAEISLAWMWARLHDRTPRLGYLQGGFQRFYDRMDEIARRLGVTTQYDTTVQRVLEKRGNFVVETTRGHLLADRVVSTLPTRTTLQMLPTMPTFDRRYNRGAALGAHCVILALDRSLSDVYWLSVNDPGYPFLVVVEHTNFIPPAEYGGRHLVYLGNYLPMDHPLFRMSQEEVLATFLPALARIFPAFSPSWVQQSWLFAAPNAQPVVTTDYYQHIPPHETPIPGLYLANMFQVYPHDRGQNYAVAMANQLAQQLTSAVGTTKQKVPATR